MAKFKPARGGKPKQRRPSPIGCIVLLVLAFAIVYLVMYYAIRG